MRTEIKVLGPLEVSIAGTSVVPTASKIRQLLAILAINAGRVVTIPALIEEIWGNQPPRSVAATLQTYILQLRRRLGPALAGDGRSARDVLTTTHTGYLLDVDRDTIDAERYERLGAAGRTAATAGDYPAASRQLTAALEIWRGPALVDVAIGAQLRIEATRLEESRLTDLTLRIDTDLYLGRHHQLLSELAALCAQHPFIESFWAQYMLALYRCSRPGQALEQYHTVQKVMRERLGVDPSQWLQRIHLAIVTGDTVMDDPGFLVTGSADHLPARRSA
ncbi:MAG: BTAD domain-containing putative transcriptional regulator [Labedaea sp.]